MQLRLAASSARDRVEAASRDRAAALRSDGVAFHVGVHGEFEPNALGSSADVPFGNCPRPELCAAHHAPSPLPHQKTPDPARPHLPCSRLLKRSQTRALFVRFRHKQITFESNRSECFISQ